jgi:hypothetical protein
MGKVYTGLDERLRQFISAQPVFFVATAPSGSSGHVNVSPKGYRDTFAILGPRAVAYLDLTGSGAETIAHLRQNGRITIMFCSFTSQPKILRLQGTGEVVRPGEPAWPALSAHFPATAGGAGQIGTASRRAIVLVALDRIADSCGYAVPVMELVGERDLLTQWAGRKTPAELDSYRAERNAVSIDGIPALGLRPGRVSQSVRPGRR